MMGSSLIYALKKNKISRDITEIVRKTQYIDILKNKQINATTDFKLVKKADFIFICSNLASYPEIIKELNQYVNNKIIIADIGSVKAPIQHLFNENYKYPKNFVAMHPIAGSEKSGCGEIIENLYENKLLILAKRNSASSKIAKIFKKLSMKIEYIKPNKHDEVYAEISHFVQLLAFSFKGGYLNEYNQILANNNPKLHKFIRLCSSDIKLWEEIFTFNRFHLERLTQQFEDNLQANNSREIMEMKITQYRTQLKRFDQLLPVDKDLDLLQLSHQYIISYLDSINLDHINYAGSGFADFIQPIF